MWIKANGAASDNKEVIFWRTNTWSVFPVVDSLCEKFIIKFGCLLVLSVSLLSQNEPIRAQKRTYCSASQRRDDLSTHKHNRHVFHGKQHKWKMNLSNRSTFGVVRMTFVPRIDLKTTNRGATQRRDTPQRNKHHQAHFRHHFTYIRDIWPSPVSAWCCWSHHPRLPNPVILSKATYADDKTHQKETNTASVIFGVDYPKSKLIGIGGRSIDVVGAPPWLWQYEEKYKKQEFSTRRRALRKLSTAISFLGSITPESFLKSTLPPPPWCRRPISLDS